MDLAHTRNRICPQCKGPLQRAYCTQKEKHLWMCPKCPGVKIWED